jgi:eukaryotic-like serine/threonine-protein kinase
MMSPIDLNAEQLFAGRYRVKRRIAAGGMGAVFEVEHVETQRRRALKVMLPELVENSELRNRFQMEARVTARVDSEYIVDVFDAGVDVTTGMPFLVMELLQGDELGDILSKSGPIPPALAVTYLRQMASALDKTHAAGIVHRDLKPENLFLTHREDGTARIKILDFGISKVVNEASIGANATRSLGTPLYMAPEQVLGQPVSPATDLYSLSLIAFTLLTGVAYWQSDAERFDNTFAFVIYTTKGMPESALSRAARFGRSLPPAFDAWFGRATHPDPARRFQRASELVNALAHALAETDVARASGPPASWPAPFSRGAVAAGTGPGIEFNRQTAQSALPRNRIKRALLVSAVGLFLLGAAASLWFRRSGNTSPSLSESASGAPPSSATRSSSGGAPTRSTSSESPPSMQSAERKPPAAAESASAGRTAASAKLAVLPSISAPVAAAKRSPAVDRSPTRKSTATEVRPAPRATAETETYTRD